MRQIGRRGDREKVIQQEEKEGCKRDPEDLEAVKGRGEDMFGCK